jgi:hypothetical protein
VSESHLFKQVESIVFDRLFLIILYFGWVNKVLVIKIRFLHRLFSFYLNKNGLEKINKKIK